MKNVIAIAIAAVSFNAAALTFQSGQVLETNADGTQSVVNVEDSAYGKSQLEKEGFVVGGGAVVIQVNGVAVSTSIHELAGRTKDQQKEIIKENAVEVLTATAVEDAINKAAAQAEARVELEAEGINVADNFSELEAAINAGTDFAVSDDVLNVVGEEAISAAITQATGAISQEQLNAIVESTNNSAELTAALESAGAVVVDINVDQVMSTVEQSTAQIQKATADAEKAKADEWRASLGLE